MASNELDEKRDALLIACAPYLHAVGPALNAYLEAAALPAPAVPVATEPVEPWAVYDTVTCHVQRCYALRRHADEYCEDLNHASRVKSWVVVDSRIIRSDVAELNALPAPRPREEGTNA